MKVLMITAVFSAFMLISCGGDGGANDNDTNPAGQSMDGTNGEDMNDGTTGDGTGNGTMDDGMNNNQNADTSTTGGGM